MSTKHIPYIGITDFTTFEQVQEMLEVLKTNVRSGCPRRLHVGVMMSRNCLLLQPKEYKWEEPILDPDDIPPIFGSTETLNTIHYADPKWKDDPEFEENLYRAIMCGGPNTNGLQLDLAWPSPTAIVNAVTRTGRKIEVIQQISGAYLDGEPDALIEKLKRYDGIIDHVLLDKSRGKGIGMDAEALLPYARAIRKAFPKLGLAAAGGLSAGKMHLINPLMEEFPDLSFDAQGQMRPSGSILDPIEMELCGNFIYSGYATALHFYRKTK